MDSAALYFNFESGTRDFNHFYEDIRFVRIVEYRPALPTIIRGHGLQEIAVLPNGRLYIPPHKMEQQSLQQQTPPASSYACAAEPAGDASQFEQECLDEHNRLRALHGCPPLTLSRHLSAYASEWAKRIASLGDLKHRSERTYGENLYMISAGCPIDGKVPVKSWYDEINQYNYSRPGFSMTTGHFTQVVWKDTKEMGVAVERRNNGTWVVANYSPHGNFNNQFVQNVPKRLR